MINKDLIVLDILDKLEYSYGDIAKKEHGNSPQILVGELIESFIFFDSSEGVSEDLNLGIMTIKRTMKRLFPNTSLKGKGRSWGSYFLLISNYKKCSICRNIKEKAGFYTSVAEFDKLAGICKNCDRLGQEINKNTINKSKRKHYRNNKQQYINRNAKRRAREIERMPKWANDLAILEMYEACPRGYHVDHIIPLQHELVSGLHVHNNLQHLTAEENLRKSNSFEI